RGRGPARGDRRLAEEPHTTWPISDAELASWAGSFERMTPTELDGSEPVPDPPTGFAAWAAWRADRWPARIDRGPAPRAMVSRPQRAPDASRGPARLDRPA